MLWYGNGLPSLWRYFLLATWFNLRVLGLDNLVDVEEEKDVSRSLRCEKMVRG